MLEQWEQEREKEQVREEAERAAMAAEEALVRQWMREEQERMDMEEEEAYQRAVEAYMAARYGQAPSLAGRLSTWPMLAHLHPSPIA